MSSILDYFTEGYTPRNVQRSALLDIEEKWNTHDVFILNLPVACHDPEQEVIMYGGEIRKIKDVQAGDYLQGPDGKPRKVLQIHSGQSEMVEVSPFRSKPFKITKNHVLNLRRYVRPSINGTRVGTFIKENISAEEYINKSADYKHSSWLWRAGQDYPTKEVCIPPYILGIWLGDGSSDTSALTTMDIDIELAWTSWGFNQGCYHIISDKRNNKAQTIKLSTDRGKPNPCLNLLKSIGVLKNKHIPSIYLKGSRQQRLELLAGLIDTDGYVNSSTASIEITQKRNQLAKDIQQLCWSLGYSCTITIKAVNDVEYYRLIISGVDIEQVPVRLQYKKPKNSKSNQSNRKFTIREYGIGEYYGVTVDGDNLYLMGDYTVTHNSGKSHVAMTIARWAFAKKQLKSNIITPTNLLVNQYKKDFDGEIKILSKKADYICKRSATIPCIKQSLKKNLGHQCSGCIMTNAKKHAEEGPITICNTWIYKANRIYKPLLIIDEAHNTLDFIREMNLKKRWRHKDSYPDNLNSYRDAVEWFNQNGYEEMMEKMGFNGEPKYLINSSYKPYGKDREPKHCLEFKPVDVSSAAPVLWPPSKIDKIILMSATLSSKDIEYLGLDKRRVCTISCSSPIIAERRPVLYQPVGSMAAHSQNRNLERLAQSIEEALRIHTGQKGLVHVTYSLAAKLRPLLANNPRFIWHTKQDKKKQYAKFRASRPEDGKVLIASGLYEGVDLPSDAGRFQIIAKVPWPSLGDPVTKYLTEKDPEYYSWETIKIVLQACGRICRRLDDWGITYIVDSTFERLYTENRDMFPTYFQESLQGIECLQKERSLTSRNS